MNDKPCYEELECRVRELEQAKEELRHVRRQLQEEIHWRRLLVEESIDSIVVLNIDGFVHEANRQFADMLGYSMKEVRKLHVMDWEAKHSSEAVAELIREVDTRGHRFLTQHRRKDGSLIDVELSNSGTSYHGQKLVFCICRDVTEAKSVAEERERLLLELQDAAAEIKTLQGILPICSFCKRVRDDKGYWEKVDVYLSRRAHADISHSICPDCLREHYPEWKHTLEE